MTTTMTPYRSGQSGRDGFLQLLRAEWTKFRTVRGWIIAAIVVAALTAAAPIWLASTAKANDPETCVRGQCQAEGSNVAIGPAGTAVVDTFYFVHQPIGTNGSITVRVSSFGGSGHRPAVPTGYAPAPQTEPWAKAGIIIKSSTRPGTVYAAAMVTGAHGVRMQYNFTHDIAGTGTAAPQWLRLTRSGDTITGYDSADGKQWTKIGSAVVSGLPPTAQVGLFVASPDFNEATGNGDNRIGGPTAASAVFDHVHLTGGSAGQSWTGSQVGTGTGGLPTNARVKCHGCGPSNGPGPGGFASTNGAFSVHGTGDMAPFEPIVDPLHVSFFGTLFGLIVVIALGALFITAEYRRGLIRTTLASSPRRGRVLAAKTIVIGAVAFVAGLVGAAIAFPVTEQKLADNGWRPPVWPHYSIISGIGLQVVLGTAAIAAGAAILGLVAGVVFRRSTSAVMTIIGLVVVPVILAVVMPIGVGTWLLRLTPAAALSLQSGVQRYTQVSNVCAPYHACFPLAGWNGFAVLGAWAIVAFAGASYLLRRRDV